MHKISKSPVSIAILAVITGVVGITACADTTAPHNDCQIVNGVLVCKPS